MSSLIKRMAHVSLETPDLGASIAWATTVMGLKETERVDGIAYLTHGPCHHSLEFIAGERSALDHISLEAHDGAALDQVTQRVRDAGLRLLEGDAVEPGVERSIRFLGPEGHVIEVFAGMRDVSQPFTGNGVQPLKFGHPTLTCQDVGAHIALFRDVLEFRISDVIGDELLAFLRCNPEHHGIGLQRGVSGLNHYAWKVESLAILGQLGDVLARHGGRFIWGPGRHGAGNNLFTYHYDPAGAVVEYYADIYQVWDERSYVPGHWSLDDHRGQNLWGPTTPQELIETYTPLRGAGA